jgi:predicted permease
MLHALRERLDTLLRARARDRELDEEIAQHLDIETAWLRAQGLSPAEARLAALARFGDPAEVAAATRAVRTLTPVEGTMKDVRYALRSFARNPGFFVVALVTLALGIGATSAAFAVLDAVLLQPLPYRGADRLVFLQEVTATGQVNPPSHPNFLDWRERVRSFDGVASAMFPFPRTVRPSPEAEPVRVTTMGVSQGFFRILGVPLAVGREFTEDENRVGGPPRAIVSHEFWQNELGGRMPPGDLRMGNETIASVIGVLPPDFLFVTRASVFIPHEQGPGTCRTCRNYMVVGRLKPDVTIGAARTEMAALSSAMLAEYGDGTTAVNVRVSDLRDYVVGDYRTLLTVVFGAATIVLLVACTNLLSAQLARGWAREREVLVRSALGASRARLLRQLAIENGLLVGLGTVLGVGIAAAATGLIRAVGGDQLPRLSELSVDLRVLGFAALVGLVTTFTVGLLPAVRLSRADAGMALRGARGTGAAVRLSAWRALLGFEIALAVALSVGAILLVRTFSNIMNADTGFAPRGLVTAAITPTAGDTSRLGEARVALEALPGVESVAYTTRLPLSWGANSGPVRRPSDGERPREWPAMAGFRMVSPGYFGVLRQPVLRGRTFTESDREGSPHVAIITTGIAERLWPGEDPLGKTVASNYLYDEWLTVVGVVAEASHWSMPRGEQNEIYVPWEQHRHAVAGQGQIVAIIRATAGTTPLLAPVRSSLRSTLPDSPALIGTMEQRIERSAADRRFAMLALTAFAGIALLLAAIGIYGVVWYTVSTRTRDIGVRIALGASPGSVRRGVLGSVSLIALIGSVIGGSVALSGVRLFEASLYGVSGGDPLSYGLSVGIVVLAVLSGAWVPARRASRVDPLVAMRADG